MQADEARGLHCFVEVAVHGFADVCAQLLQGFSLAVNSQSQCRGCESTTHFVFANLKDDLAHCARHDKGWALILQAAHIQASDRSVTPSKDWLHRKQEPYKDCDFRVSQF